MQKHDGTYTPSTDPVMRYFEDNAVADGRIYMILVASCFLIFNIRTQTYYRHCMKCSMKIYDRLFYAVLRSPMSFFETTPLGTI